jgi:hypothetical protein
VVWRCPARACTDQRERWLRGDRPAAETYLQLHDSFYGASEHAVEVVLGEFLLRRQLGEAPTLSACLTDENQFAPQVS